MAKRKAAGKAAGGPRRADSGEGPLAGQGQAAASGGGPASAQAASDVAPEPKSEPTSTTQTQPQAGQQETGPDSDAAPKERHGTGPASQAQKDQPQETGNAASNGKERAKDDQQAHAFKAQKDGTQEPGPDSDAPPETKPQASGPGSQAGKAEAGNTADSNVTPRDKHETGQAIQGQGSGQQEPGNVPAPTSASNTAKPLASVRYQDIRDRLMKHQDWPRILATVREMRADSKLADMKTEHRERFIWGEMDRLYPPLADDRQKAQIAPTLHINHLENEGKQAASSQVADSGRVQGLGDIPPGWPPLPANAGMAAEIAWVQANRLYVVEELASGGTRVRLERAHEPAPSRAAIGWLETSIRSYAKFVEVAAKASSSGLEEQDQVKQERMQIEEIRGLLAEMRG